MPDLVETYYRGTSEADAQRLERGQLCWGPGLFLAYPMTILELEHYDPQDESQNRYAIQTNPPAGRFFNHNPVNEIRLQSDEELLVIKAKRRLMVVMSQQPKAWYTGDGRLTESGYVCLPFYSFQPRDTPEFKARIQALEYPSWIYLPGDQSSGVAEGFVRLDRLQLAERRSLEPRRQALTDEALWFLSEWLRYYLTEEIEQLFMDDRADRLNRLAGH